MSIKYDYQPHAGPDFRSAYPAQLGRRSRAPGGPNGTTLGAYCLCVYLAAVVVVLAIQSLLQHLF